MRWMMISAAVLAILAGGSGCDGESPMVCELIPGTASEKRADGIASLEREVLAPRRAALIAASGRLVTAMDGLCAAPTADSLGAARGAWFVLQTPIKSFELFEIGPLLADRLYSRLQFWPTRLERLQDAIEGAPAGGYGPAAVLGLGTAVTGLAALEVLLFRGSTIDAASCAYGQALATDLASTATLLAEKWDGPGGFGETLKAVGRGSAVFPCVQPAVDDFVNIIVNGLQRLYETKLGGPLGTTSGGAVALGALEHPFADGNLASIGASLAAFEVMWHGLVGLGAAVNDENSLVFQAVSEQLARALAALEAARSAGSMADQLGQDPTRIEALRVEIKALYRLFAVEVANVLGTRLRFSDNDGD